MTAAEELRERLDILEMTRDGMREIEGDFMRELEGKGYEIVRHGDRPCYLCTIGHVVGDLPRKAV